MTKQITLEEALRLVSFYHTDVCGWGIHTVDGDIHGDVNGDIHGDVNGDVGGIVYGAVDGDVHGAVGGNIYGDGGVIGDVHGSIGGNVDGHVYGAVRGDVGGDVDGNVKGRINGRVWRFVETPKDKLQRLITESGNQELIDAFNQMENN